jgi:group II intron reverse transcriptase/maturase
MGETLSSQTVSTKLRKIAMQAVEHPDRVFTTLAHLIDVEFLREAYRRTRKSGAPGVDGVTAKEYAANLEDNLRDLHDRLRNQRYKASPVERTWIEKEDGRQRPIGKPTFEDKIVQRAVVMLLEQIYETDFHDFSYGFRKGRSPHQALRVLRERCMGMKLGWIIDADVSGFFDSICHRKLFDILRRRVNDGSILRLIGKWLNAGVLDGGNLTHPETGTPQGGVVSPMIGNVFLHHVLDDWFVSEVEPRMKGRVFLIRFADDFVVGCEREDDARRIMDVLPKRFDRFGLTIHPEKTKLIAFGKPPRATTTRPPRVDPNDGSGANPSPGPSRGNGTFDFLGFTHYWARSRRGYWVIKRKTARKRLRRTKKALWQWCRDHLHYPVKVQHLKLCQKLRGHFQYFGITSNFQQLVSVRAFTRKAWRYWLSRRNRKRTMTWDRFQKLLDVFELPQPRIIHRI